MQRPPLLYHIDDTFVKPPKSFSSRILDGALGRKGEDPYTVLLNSCPHKFVYEHMFTSIVVMSVIGLPSLLGSQVGDYASIRLVSHRYGTL